MFERAHMPENWSTNSFPKYTEQLFFRAHLNGFYQPPHRCSKNNTLVTQPSRDMVLTFELLRY